MINTLRPKTKVIAEVFTPHTLESPAALQNPKTHCTISPTITQRLIKTRLWQD